MVVVCWSAKGGAGTSVVVAGLAIGSTRRNAASRTVVVDTAGDIPAILAMSEPAVGVSEWIAQPTAFDLRDLLVERSSNLFVLPLGTSPLPEPRSGSWSRLALELSAMSALGSTIIVDAGNGPPPDALVHVADRSHVVVRPCYLALRRTKILAERAHSAILVLEPNRVLTASDVASVLDVPIEAHVSLDADVARRVDAGVISTRPPLRLLADLTPVLDGWQQR